MVSHQIVVARAPENGAGRGVGGDRPPPPDDLEHGWEYLAGEEKSGCAHSYELMPGSTLPGEGNGRELTTSLPSPISLRARPMRPSPMMTAGCTETACILTLSARATELREEGQQAPLKRAATAREEAGANERAAATANEAGPERANGRGIPLTGIVVGGPMTAAEGGR